MDIMSWLQVVFTTIGAAATVATITPNRSANVVGDIILRVINVLAMNFGNAKNEVK